MAGSWRPLFTLDTIIFIMNTCINVLLFRERGDVSSQLAILTRMAQIQCFPEDQLSQLFNLEFLTKMDNYMERKGIVAICLVNCIFSGFLNSNTSI